jgi:hypothetical protein
MSTVRKCSGPISRRGLLQVGSLGLAGLGFADLLHLQSQAKAAAGSSPDTSVIFVWLPGGPPHLDMYDMKPDAPEEIRGPFRPISTNVPGLDVCELMPLHTKLADKFSIVRSIAHKFADHGGGHKRFLTGRDPFQPDGFVNDFPMIGSVVSKLREGRNVGLPNYICGADNGRTHIDVFSFGSAYLGPSTYPFTFGGDPSQPNFKVENLALLQELDGRLGQRESLLKGLDQLRRGVDRSGMMEAMDQFSRKAVDLVTSEKARKAFDLSLEPQETREKYGMHPWSQRALMARRLVEAGASFVTMVMENPVRAGEETPKDVVYNWDSHAVNCHIWTDLKWRLPRYDQAIMALVEDLYARGLDKKVLLVVTGEFGRTPRIEQAVGRPGRDHWPQAMSMLLSGGGMQMGQIVGSTNARGEEPKDRPMTPNDLWATVLRHLGIDQNHAFLDLQGRPLSILPFGEPIKELVG